MQSTYTHAYVCLMYCRCNGNYGRCCYCYLLLFFVLLFISLFCFSFLCFANVDFLNANDGEKTEKMERHHDNISTHRRRRSRVDARMHSNEMGEIRRLIHIKLKAEKMMRINFMGFTLQCISSAGLHPLHRRKYCIQNDSNGINL